MDDKPRVFEKMTPELFSAMPKEIQEDVLKNVPADKLNQIGVVALPIDMNKEDAIGAIVDAWSKLSRAEACSAFMELLVTLCDPRFEPIPPEGDRNVAMIGIAFTAINRAKRDMEKLNKEGE